MYPKVCDDLSPLVNISASFAYVVTIGRASLARPACRDYGCEIFDIFLPGCPVATLLSQ